MRSSVFAALIFVAGAACSDSPAEPHVDAPAAGTFSALLDGAPFNSDSGKAAGTGASSGRFQIVAYDSNRVNPVTMTLFLFNIAGPGIYPLGVGESAIGGFVDLKVGSAAYHQLGTGSGGTIVITHVSPTRLAGKFFMNFLYPTEFGPGGSNVALTEANFDVPITSAGSIAVPENRGSWAVGAVGTKFWRAARFEANKDYFGSFIIRTGNSDYEVTFGFRNVSGPGQYQMGPSGGGGITVKNQSDDWALYPDKPGGTMTISSFSANRVVGWVNTVVYPSVGSLPAGALPVRISFDIGLAPP